MLLAPLHRRGHVADRRVEPDVPEVAGAVGNLEAEVRSGTGHIPISQRLTEKVPFEIICHFALQVLAGLRPFFEEPVQLLDADKQVIGRAEFGRRAGQRAGRVDEIGGRVRRAALLAIVAVLILGLTLRARPFDKAIRQERARLRIVELRHGLLGDVPALAERGPDLMTEFAVRLAIGAAVVIELDIESGEVADVSVTHVGNQCFFATAFLPGTNHDRRAVRIVGANEDALMAAQLLEPDPNVGLDVFDQMADVDVPVRVWQRGGH